ncbi:trehalose-phosphatase [Aestuariimicrobium soli]|uniref:trehalose-phosphatase n=1 Tax=Aestuariimicrobium soli TaxID=2035834 RepID=UPI003EB90FA9
MSAQQPPSTVHWQTVTDRGEAFLAALLERPGQALLAFDFDGTLSPMVADPEAAVVSDDARAALLTLSRQVGRVAIITGRPVETVRRLARLDEDDFASLVVLGQYGVERLDCATGEVRSPEVGEAFREAVREITALVEQVGASEFALEGVFLEDKGRALGVHTRRAADPEGALERLDAPVRAIAEAHGLQLEPGKLVLEVREQATSKAEALRELVGELTPELVLMAGDDLGDVPAFEELDRLADEGLVTAALVSGSTERPELAAHADLAADGVDGVAAFLGWLVHSLS